MNRFVQLTRVIDRGATNDTAMVVFLSWLLIYLTHQQHTAF